MKPNFLNYAGGLGLMAGALLWSSPSRAQSYCYMVDADGQVINLNDLCESESDAQLVQPQPEAPGMGEAAVEPQEGASRVRSYTLTGPAAIPGSTTPTGSPTGQPGAAEESPGATPESTDELPEATPEATTDPADSMDANDTGTEPRIEENRLDIPVREIETPQIPTPQTQPPQITTPEAQDSTDDTTDSRGRPANDTVSN
ncbi:MAG: hypothetical protein WBG32_17220 [Nodosilinea sp.]